MSHGRHALVSRRGGGRGRSVGLLVRPSAFLPFVVLLLACGHDFEPPDRGERIRAAEAQYSAELFDSVTWTSREARVQEGNAVYAEDCRRCHGHLGRGATDYAAERRLDVPSLVEADWQLADLGALRREIYVGHETGMPTFGQGGLSLRQIDAVSAYILDVLRPEVLGDAVR